MLAEVLAVAMAVALVWAVAAVTPGPNFLVVARTAVTQSRRAALGVVAGIVAGTVVWGSAGFLGIQALFEAAPALYAALKLFGGLYLIFLGLQLLRRAARDKAPVVVPPISAGWRLGIATSLANPKTAAFVASLFAATLPPDPSWWLGIISVALMAAVSLLWYGAVAVVLAAPTFAAKYRRLRRWIDALAGAVFVAFGARLAGDA